MDYLTIYKNMLIIFEKLDHSMSFLMWLLNKKIYLYVNNIIK